MFYQLEHIGANATLKKERGENFSYPQHLHQCFELIIVDEGEMDVRVNDTSYTLKKDMALLVFPNQIHSIHSERSKHTLFIFSTHIVQKYYNDVAGKLPMSNQFHLSPSARVLLNELCEDSSKYEQKGTLYTVCALFDANASYYDAATDKGNTLFKILSYVEKNFHSACTVEDIAKNIHYNPEYISRFFKEKMGFSCNSYINLRRLNHAAYLLTNTGASCLCCSIESGFTSLRSFNRNFKKHFGISPSEYKKQRSS